MKFKIFPLQPNMKQRGIPCSISGKFSNVPFNSSRISTADSFFFFYRKTKTLADSIFTGIHLPKTESGNYEKNWVKLHKKDNYRDLVPPTPFRACMSIRNLEILCHRLLNNDYKSKSAFQISAIPSNLALKRALFERQEFKISA